MTDCLIYFKIIHPQFNNSVIEELWNSIQVIIFKGCREFFKSTNNLKRCPQSNNFSQGNKKGTLCHTGDCNACEMIPALISLKDLRTIYGLFRDIIEHFLRIEAPDSYGYIALPT